MLGTYLHLCPSRCYDVLEEFQKACIFKNKALRESYMQDLLDTQILQGIKMELEKFIIHKYNNYERIIKIAYVDITQTGQDSWSKKMLIATNQQIILASPPSPCPEHTLEYICNPPDFEKQIQYEDITEVYRVHKQRSIYTIKSDAYHLIFGKNQDNDQFIQIIYEKKKENPQKDVPTEPLFRKVVDQILSNDQEGPLTFDDILISSWVSFNPEEYNKPFFGWSQPRMIESCKLVIATKNKIIVLREQTNYWPFIEQSIIEEDIDPMNSQSSMSKQNNQIVQEAEAKLFIQEAVFMTEDLKKIRFNSTGQFQMTIIFENSKPLIMCFQGDSEREEWKLFACNVMFGKNRAGSKNYIQKPITAIWSNN